MPLNCILKMDYRTNITEPLDENIGVNLYGRGFGNGFLDMTAKAQ